MMRILILIFYFFLVGSVRSSDEIYELPGLSTKLNFSQYAGYVNINKEANQNLFYWFVESQNNPSTDSLVLWLNGGPGCSSFNGFFEELGPFYVKKDLTLGMNKYSWNRNANVLFLESPLGVGFSYSNNTQDYTTGDEETAERSLQFLIGFFEKYPQFQSNEFYITGESYCGHYIPDLVLKVLNYNSKHENGNINLVGFAIGNPWTDSSIDNVGVIDYIFSHNLISHNTYHGIKKFCNFTGQPYTESNDVDPEKCNYYAGKMHQEEGNINAYDIYTDVCTNMQHSDAKALHHSWSNSDVPLKKYAQHIMDRDPNLSSPYDPCIDNYVIKYLNDADVQRAIHAKKPADPWTPCSSYVNQHYSKYDIAASKLERYPNILGKGLKVVIYSGDVDSVVPATGTRMWLNVLNLQQTSSWKPWTDSANQVGGYVVRYDKQDLVFVTVRNAGHEVPSFQPLRAFDLFNSFILRKK